MRGMPAFGMVDGMVVGAIPAGTGVGAGVGVVADGDGAGVVGALAGLHSGLGRRITTTLGSMPAIRLQAL